MKSTNPEERAFYYSELPTNKEYEFAESFYFKISEFSKPKSLIDYVIISKICFIDEPNVVNNISFRYTYPNIPKSIIEAVNEVEKLISSKRNEK